MFWRTRKPASQDDDIGSVRNRFLTGDTDPGSLPRVGLLQLKVGDKFHSLRLTGHGTSPWTRSSPLDELLMVEEVFRPYKVGVTATDCSTQ
jgi:hypothetical protein